MNPIPSLLTFRDIALKLALPSDLESALKRFSDRPASAISDQEQPAYVEEALALADRCLAFLEAESGRLAEQRYSAPDPNTLKQKLIADPRRQVEGLVNQLKQKLSNEKQEWNRRIAKQLTDITTSLEEKVDSMTVVEGGGQARTCRRAVR